MSLVRVGASGGTTGGTTGAALGQGRFRSFLLACARGAEAAGVTASVRTAQALRSQEKSKDTNTTRNLRLHSAKIWQPERVGPRFLNYLEKNGQKKSEPSPPPKSQQTLAAHL